MSVLEVDLSFLFVVAVILIWFMIAYQFALTIFGYINFLKSFRERRIADAMQVRLPDVHDYDPGTQRGCGHR